MFGINYLKVPPTTHVMQYKGGQVVRSGAGLSFFYYCADVGDRRGAGRQHGRAVRVQRSDGRLSGRDDPRPADLPRHRSDTGWPRCSDFSIDARGGIVRTIRPSSTIG